MFYVGIDIGSLSTKSVIIDEQQKIIACDVILTSPDSEGSGREVLRRVLEKTGMNADLIEGVVATGYGRINLSFANSHVTEISCHARGINYCFPEVQTILDIGGQDCKVIRCNSKGQVLDFSMNVKCAAGTGRYLERVAATLGIDLFEFGPRSLEVVERPCEITSFCAVFAERDVIMLLRQGKHPNDILAGAAEAIVNRIRPLIDKVGMKPEFAISGGVAKNLGVVSRLKRVYSIEPRIPFESQIAGALGAALFALDRHY